jgi:nucleotide-binding universal stress UspA family protein
VSATPQPAPTGPVVVAYDGSELSQLAIEQAGALLSAGREALVVCVWEPFDVGFVPVDDAPLDAKQAQQVKAAAGRTADAGAALAQAAGFDARGLAVEATPTWKGIVETAEEHESSAIVLGSHGRSSLAAKLIGSVAAAVADHSRRTVVIIHRHP